MFVILQAAQLGTWLQLASQARAVEFQEERLWQVEQEELSVQSRQYCRQG